jgi:hypothetical protein
VEKEMNFGRPKGKKVISDLAVAGPKAFSTFPNFLFFLKSQKTPVHGHTHKRQINHRWVVEEKGVEAETFCGRIRNMWGQGQGQSYSLPLWNPQAVKLKAGIPFLVVPGLMRQRSVSVALAGNRDPRLRILPLPNWKSSSPSPSTVSVSAFSQTLSSALAPIQLLKLKAPGFRPSPQLGLLSLLFALSMVTILHINYKWNALLLLSDVCEHVDMLLCRPLVPFSPWL